MKLFKLPKKKFRVRIKYYAGGWTNRWYIEYAYYRFIPFWNTIYEFNIFEGVGKWRDKYFFFKSDAEEFANNLNSIDDIYKHYQKSEERVTEHEKHLVKQSEYYKTKYIK